LEEFSVHIYGNTPISDVKARGHKDIVQYLKQQLVLRVIMKHMNMFPFWKDIPTIIVQYLPYSVITKFNGSFVL